MSASTVTHSDMNSKPSKSARKSESLALQNLGEQLLDLAPEQLTSIGLEHDLLAAVLAAKTMHARGALRRQRQLIGKLMRHTDPEPISAALAANGRRARLEKELFRQAEDWRERLIGGRSKKEKGAVLEEFFAVVGTTNTTLVDAVQRWQSALDEGARKRLKRKIFREVHNDLTSKVQNNAGSI